MSQDFEPDDHPHAERWGEMLEAGAAEDVLLATEACLDDDPADDVAALFRVYALGDLGLLVEAYEAMSELAATFGGDPFVQAELARTAFMASRFPAAHSAARAALEADPDEGLAYWVLGQLADREDDFEGADLHFERAHQQDPDAFPLRTHVSDDEFADTVRGAIGKLPPVFQEALSRVSLLEEPVPSDSVLATLEPEMRDPTLLGLYVGPANEGSVLDEASATDLPPTIYLFRRNIERASADATEIREQIAITLFHELGHHLGFDEDEMAALDLQ